MNNVPVLVLAGFMVGSATGGAVVWGFRPGSEASAACPQETRAANDAEPQKAAQLRTARGLKESDFFKRSTVKVDDGQAF